MKIFSREQISKIVCKILKIPKIDTGKESFFVKKTDVNFLLEFLNQIFS